MSALVWSSGHLGWGVFALAVFTGLWFLVFDLVWRLKSIKIGRLAIGMSIGWLIGLGLILLVFYLGT